MMSETADASEYCQYPTFLSQLVFHINSFHHFQDTLCCAQIFSNLQAQQNLVGILSSQLPRQWQWNRCGLVSVHLQLCSMCLH